MEPSHRKAYIRTFGCQMNVYDTAKMYAQLAADGFSEAASPEEADLILINTCSIREKAQHKVHSTLGMYRRLRREGQAVRLGVVGCVAQQEGEALLERYPDLDIVFGPDGVSRVREIVSRAFAGERVVDTRFVPAQEYHFPVEIDPFPAPVTGGLVTIQKGCDNHCTYCIVPSVRGPEVSRPSAEVLDEVRSLVSEGARDITLIGQNVNSYGLKDQGEIPFAALLRQVAAVPGVDRVRFTSPHPRDMGPDVVECYRDLTQLVSHLHLPVQSGSDRTLRRMGRQYTRQRFLDLVDALRRARPDLSLTTDLIVGFPGETEEDFLQTLSLLDDADIVGSFSFKYSPRPGTAGERLKERVDPAVASDRLTRLQARQRERSSAWHHSLVGQTVQILVEGPSAHDEGVICGRTSTGAMINFPGELSQHLNRLVEVEVTGAFTHSCRGVLSR